MNELQELGKYLDSPASSFPSPGEGIKIMLGKTLFRNYKWHKALLLVVDRNKKLQLRFYAWQKYKDSDTWKVRQKYNVALSHLNNLCNLLYDINTVFEQETERKYLLQRKQEEGTLPKVYEARLKELQRLEQLKAQLVEHPRFVKSENENEG